MNRLLPLLLFMFWFNCLKAQKYDSRNGYNLPVNGSLRILVLLVEVDYEHIEDDPTGPKGDPHWRAHSLPDWVDNLDPSRNAFDSEDETPSASGLFSKYYDQASFGNLRITADYLLPDTSGAIFKVPSTDGVVRPQDAIQAVNQHGNRMATYFRHDDIGFFDQWKISSPGQPKLRTEELDSTPVRKWDHVMIIWRNNRGRSRNATNDGYIYNSINGNGFCSAGSPGVMLGYAADTYSNFSVYGALNVNIMRHEFAHLIYGGNNFHVAGGGNGEANYWIPKISAYSNLSLYDATLACWNGWDRQRLGWMPDGNRHVISARNPETGEERNGDLDVTNPDQAGTYLLRDFITTGDVLRIKIPHLDPEKNFCEYLWIENHHGRAMNGSPFDKWLYEDNPCIEPAAYGLYMYMQIARDVNASDNFQEVFGGHADYLRPVTADGFYDRELDTLLIPEECLGNIPVRPFRRPSGMENPLTGGGDNDQISGDFDGNGKITSKDQYPNDIEDVNGIYRHDFVQNGNNRQVFTLNGERKIGMGTNPSTASMISLAGFDTPLKKEKNVRTTHLNEISVTILSQDTLGNIIVRVLFDDTDMEENARWCSGNIVLHPNPSPSGFAMKLKAGKELLLDRGLTPTRMDEPDTVNGKLLFTDSTSMTFLSGSRIKLEKESRIVAIQGSKICLEDSTLTEVEEGASFVISSGSRLEIRGGAKIQLKDHAEIIISKDAAISYYPGSSIALSANSRLIIHGTIELKEGAVWPFRKSKKIKFRKKSIVTL